MPKVVRFVDLFSGAGGLSQGFKQASDEQLSFVSCWAVEHDEAAAATYTANFGHAVFSGEIEDVRPTDLPSDIDLLIGGPPCQGFSALGRMSPTDHHPRMNKLWEHYFRILELLEPSVFVVENVPEFLQSYECVAAKAKASDLGYIVSEGVLNAAEFGVPQKRRRGFLIGSKSVQIQLPSPLQQPLSDVRSVIGDLVRRKPILTPTPSGSVLLNGTSFSKYKASDLHIGRRPTPMSLERYAAIPAGGNRFSLMEARPDITPRCWIEKKSGSTDVMGRLWWKRPAVTIRTEFFKPEKGRYLHPTLDRPITHLEAARLQSFPDDYWFCGSKTEIARQIGNAVPPKLAAALAQNVKAFFLARKKSKAKAATQKI